MPASAPPTPDRIARTIDGLDMLYSACASIARKPAMDLRLERMDGTVSRDLHFVGESDSVSAVSAVIGSIPAALDAFDDDAELDLERVVRSLPIFDDLKRLGQFGTFTPTDLGDISETMHQGAVLVLESGVSLVDERAESASTTAFTPRDSHGRPLNGDHHAAEQSENAYYGSKDQSAFCSNNSAGQSSTSEDEHYQRYLREREAMLDTPIDGLSAAAMDEQRRRDAVEDLLKNLGRARSER